MTMKRLVILLVVLGLLFQPALAGRPTSAQGPAPAGPAATGGTPPAPRYLGPDGQPATLIEGMPGYPLPELPVPYHRPGHLAKTNLANAERLAATYGLDQPLSLDGALQSGVLADPFAGNPRFVDWDQVAAAWIGTDGIPHLQGVSAATLITMTPRITASFAISGSHYTPEGLGAQHLSVDVADLNNDGWDEAIMASKGPTTTAWVTIGDLVDAPPLASSPAAASWGPAGKRLFALDADRHLRSSSYNGTAWSVWQDLGTPPGVPLTMDPAATSWGEGRFDVLALGSDGHLYHRAYAGTGWAAWEDLGGNLTSTVTIASSPAVTTWGINRLDVAVIGSDTHTYHRWYDGASWSAWEDLGGGCTLAPAIIANGVSVLEVFVRGTDNALHHRWYNGSTWSNWESLGGGLLSAPAALGAGGNHIDVFVVGAGNQLYHTWWTGSNWSAWEGLGGSFSSRPAVAAETLTTHSFRLYGANTQGEIWSRGWDETAGWWPGWYRVPGFTPPSGRGDSSPAAVVLGTDDLHAFVRGRDDAMWAAEYDTAPVDAWFWNGLGGTLASAPAVTLWGPADVAAFALNPDGYLYNARGTIADGAISWGSWTAMTLPNDQPGILTLDPAATSWGAGHLDVFMRGADHTLWHVAYDGGAWGGWENLGGVLTSSPAAASPGSDQLAVASCGFDNALWYRSYTDGTWSRWQSLGGDCASAPALVSPGSGQLSAFVRGSDGAIWHRDYDGSSWGAWASLGGSFASAPGAAAAPDGTVHLLARDGAGALWRAVRRGGTWEAWELLPGGPQSCCFTSNAGITRTAVVEVLAGHFLGDGRAQVALLTHVDSGTSALNLYRAVDGFYLQPVDEELFSEGNDCPYRFRELAAGDFDGDGVDEIAVIVSLDCGHQSTIRIYKVENGVLTRKGELPNPGSFQLLSAVAAGDLDGDGYDDLAFGFFADPNMRLGIGRVAPDLSAITLTASTLMGTSVIIDISAGDLDGDGVDEMASTVVDTGSRLFVHKASPNLATLTEWDQLDLQGVPWVRTADLDRDLVDEIVVGEANWAGGPLSLRAFAVDLSHQLVEIGSALPVGTPQGDLTTYGLAAGNLTGQGLRVGPPTYRAINKVRSILAVINDIPRHCDTVDGNDYDINCSDLDNTYAEYQFSTGNESELSMQAQRDWSLDAEFSGTVGDEEGTHVKASVGTSYGDHFEKTQTAFTRYEINQSFQTQGDDVVYYVRADYDAWEYPVYANDPFSPSSYLTVVFPKPGSNNYGGYHTSTPGNTCDFGYRPGHLLGNVWSYPVDVGDFSDWNTDPARQIAEVGTDLGAVAKNTTTSWEGSTAEERMSEVKQSVRAGLEGQVGGDKILGIFDVPWQINFSASGEYSWQDTNIEKESAMTKTVVVQQYGAITASASYNVHSYLYWAPGGYVVLDYVATPNMGTTFWNLYDRPDPALLRPWSEGQCQAGRVDFAPEVLLTPFMAGVGDPVTVTAVVHNYSPVPVGNVLVHFYRGDPISGGVLIGTDQFVTLTARSRVTATVTFAAAGSGEQRIYAVLDPAGAIDEMHEDNNQGYGTMWVGDGAYVDPGMAARGDYETLGLGDDQALIPTEANTQTIYFKLVEPATIPPLPTLYLSAHHNLELTAYQVEETPLADITFGGSRLRPAGVMVVRYTDGDLGGMNEATLVLWRWNGFNWVDAACGEVQRYPEENWLLVPVCKTGTMALVVVDSSGLTNHVYLPLVTKGW
jgi:hypothetical protein